MSKKEKLKELLNKQQSVLLVGEPGWGQKEAVAEVAEEMGLVFLSAYASDPNAWHCYLERYGMDRYPRWAIEVDDNPDTEYLLYFDEIQECLDEEYDKFRQFVEYGIVGDMKLDNIRICAAFNIYNGKSRKDISDFDFFQSDINY